MPRCPAGTARTRRSFPRWSLFLSEVPYYWFDDVSANSIAWILICGKPVQRNLKREEVCWGFDIYRSPQLAIGSLGDRYPLGFRSLSAHNPKHRRIYRVENAVRQRAKVPRRKGLA